MSSLFLIWELYQEKKIEISINNPSGEINLYRLSLRDAKRLESFFQELVLRESWAYTLMGCKPMSFGCYYKPFSSLFFFLPPDIKLSRGWKTWKKYSHLFANPRFEMWIDSEINGLRNILLVDKTKLEEIVEQNSSDFTDVLQTDSVHPNELLKEKGNKSLVCEVLKNNNLLLGILLGYGKNNAIRFHNQFKDPPIWEKEIERPIIDRYIRKFFSFNKFDISDMFLPSFVGDPNSDESKELKKKYLAAREEIIHYYEGRNFLEATLNLYMNGPAVLEK